MMNKIETILMNGYFYKEIMLNYKNKILAVLGNPTKYKIIIFYFNQKNNNYFAINQRKIFEFIGLQVDSIKPSSISEFKYLLKSFSRDKKIVGINVELPLPPDYPLDILKEIDYRKDLDCLNPLSYYQFLQSSKEELKNIVVPSVANAVLLMLKHYNIPFENRDIVILGKSTYTGLAIAHLLLKFNSTIQILNENTKNPHQKCRQAEILISCTGKVDLIDDQYITENSVIIDVGFEVVNGKIKGDVNLEKVKGIAKAVSIVPGGVGLLCNASTIINLYKLLLLSFKDED